ncbi:AAA family ATPase [Marinobacter sp. SS21]|uniref:AAA family ATPase n=1 Tax=Marinobacter sp. SS21 TaxID=2979460 RepID=UPI00232BC300|nr:AAA family ATPase [Marinobacter sp. SS21]MDC0663755.1 AAA family ATPase [Marinobacter sp. SS21]
MRYRLEILLAGRSPEGLELLKAQLGDRSDVHVTTRLMVNGTTDPLSDTAQMPDALVLMVSQNWRAELQALIDRPAKVRPPVLVIGEKDNAEVIRVALRAGARDFLSLPLEDGEVAAFVGQLLRDKCAESSRKAARMTAVINAKGGSGASMVAANLSHILADSLNQRTALIDMDLQFGALPIYFNLSPHHGLVRALELVDSLDLLALEGYVLSHASGLDLLASTPEDRVTIAEVPEERMEMLLKILGEAYDDIVVDLPRWVSGATAMTLESADHVLVVMELGVAHLRDAQRLVSILRKELGVADSQITVVVNRFSKNSPVSLKDINNALTGLRVVTLPNDYGRVSDSINMGSPLFESAPKAPITRDLVTLAQSLSDQELPSPSVGSRWNPLEWVRQTRGV